MPQQKTFIMISMSSDSSTSTNIRNPAEGRTFYAVMGWLLVLVAFIGFAPRSIAIVGGQMPNPPLVVHLHAAAMLGWVLLLALQSSLSLVGRMDLHRRFGLLSFVSAPAVFIMLTAVTIIRQQDSAGTPAAMIVNNILFLQLRAIVLFPTFFIWAILTRRTDPQTHKRMILLATLMLVDAAIARMSWLPFNNFPVSYTGVHLYSLLLFVPPLLHDKLKLGHLHRAWLMGLALYLPWVIAAGFIWNSAWWLKVGPMLVGANG